LKPLLDLLPVFVLFGVFRFARRSPETTQAWVTALFGSVPATGPGAADIAPLILATACAMAATAVQIGWLILKRAKVSASVWLSAFLILVLGGLTVWLQNEWFIKWKPTILNWTFGAVLLGGHWIWRRNLLGALFSSELQLPGPVWDRLLLAWSAFFIAMGAVNLVVVYHFSTDTWVDFKTFGMLGLTFAFAIGTGVYVSSHLKAPTDG
jgi:intracellular septation protein